MFQSMFWRVAALAVVVFIVDATLYAGSVAGNDIANSGSFKNDGDVIRVLGRGMGLDENSARDDALCDAVKVAIGFYIEAETIAKNDKIVKDQILTHSNAYVTHYEVTSRKTTADGLKEVCVLATVRKRPLVQKLRDVMPTVTVNVAGAYRDLYATILTMDKRDADAEKLLQNEFENFDPLAQLMKVTIVNEKSPEISQSKEAEDAKILSYQLKFEIDAKRYFKTWVPHMDKILSQISLCPGMSFSFKRIKEFSNIWKDEVSKEHSEEQRTSYIACDRMQFMAGSLLDSERIIYGQVSDHASRYSGYDEYMPMGHIIACNSRRIPNPISDLWNNGHRYIRRWGAGPKMKAKGKFYFALVKKANQSGCSGTLYELSDRSASVVSAWMCAYSGLSHERTKEDRNARSTIYSVFFKDATGDEVAGGDCRVFNNDMSNIGCVCWGDESCDNRNKPAMVIPYVFYATPWVGCCASECSTWIDVEMNKEEVGRVSTYSISTDKR